MEYAVGMFEGAGAGNVDGQIDRDHQTDETYFDKKSSKYVRAFLLNLKHFGIPQ